MTEIIFIAGPDDTNHARIKKNGINTSISFKGVLPIFSLIDSNKFIFNNSSKFFIGYHHYLQHKNEIKDVVLFNLISDADACQYSLRFIIDLMKNNKFKKVLNHPEKVTNTSRGNLSDLLGGINDLLIPKVKRISINSSEELKKMLMAENFDLDLPVIIRAVGFNNSLHMELIESIDQLEHVDKLLKISSDFYLTKFYDTSCRSSYFKKYRVAVINGKVYPQHLLTSMHWNVSVGVRKSLMLDNEGLRNAEKYFFETFNSSFLHKYKHIFEAINQRISLDIYGIDFSILPDGRVVVFEANASMDLLSMWLGPHNEYEYKKPYRNQVKQAIENLLMAQ